MAEPTAALTFEDLIVEVAYRLGIADYTAGGEPAIPIDNHDLVLSKRLVNKAIRMLLSDAPPQGWRWTQPVASMQIWADVEVGTATVSGGSYDAPNNETLLTATVATFFPSMELKDIVITTSGTFSLKRYVSPTTIYVTGNASAVVTKTFSIDSESAFTLPQSFGGEYTGKITYAANTNRGVQPRWTEESVIRQRRSDSDDETGTPYEFAVRIIEGTRRRYELLCWRQPDETFEVQFPYTLYFDQLTSLTQTPPSPFFLDEVLKAACLAMCEKDVEQVVDGSAMKYYRDVCLKQAYQADNRTAPKSLGYFGNPNSRGTYPPQKDWRDNCYQRPDVSVNT